MADQFKSGRGGAREGSGPKPTGRQKVQFYITPTEKAQLQAYLAKLRQKYEPPSQ